METEIMTQDQWENTKDIVTKCFALSSKFPFATTNLFPLYKLNKKNFKDDKNFFLLILHIKIHLICFFYFTLKKSISTLMNF